MEMSRLTRDGTAEPVSRDQILRRERGQGKGESKQGKVRINRVRLPILLVVS